MINMTDSKKLSKPLKNIQRYRRRYGLAKAFRAVVHYGIRFLKQNNDSEIIQVNGYQLKIIPSDPGISSELSVFHVHEPLTTNLIKNEIKNGMTCLDIGSNIGYYAILESNLVGQKGKVIAIEPNPSNYEYLQKNLEIQQTNNTESYNFAASDKDGTIRFLIYETSNECMTIPDGEEPKYPGKVIVVPTKQIDTFVDELNLHSVDFLRMDVEGFEYYLFKGLKNTLKNFKPLIQIELHVNIMGDEKTKWILNNLKSLGYEIKFFIPRDVDVPIIGTKNDIKKFNIEKIIQMINNKTYPSFIMLILENKNKNFDENQ